MHFRCDLPVYTSSTQNMAFRREVGQHLARLQLTELVCVYCICISVVSYIHVFNSTGDRTAAIFLSHDVLPLFCFGGYYFEN